MSRHVSALRWPTHPTATDAHGRDCCLPPHIRESVCEFSTRVPGQLPDGPLVPAVLWRRAYFSAGSSPQCRASQQHPMYTAPPWSPPPFSPPQLIYLCPCHSLWRRFSMLPVPAGDKSITIKNDFQAMGMNTPNHWLILVPQQYSPVPASSSP